VSAAVKAVVTGEASESEEAPAKEAPLAKPVLVWICDAGAEPDKCEEVVFKSDKVALAAKAFRSVRVSAEDAELDPLLKGKGKETPRVLVIDTERKVTVLEKSKLTAGGVFDAMKKVVRDTWNEDVEAKVKAQLKILNETDKLAAEEQQLSEKEGRISSDKEGDKKDLEEIKKERAEIRTKREELVKETKDLWAFVSKKPADAAAAKS
jgi:ABC-type phosphate/phosphonate transport system substrate-binding protein